MALKVFNSLTLKKEVFEPLVPGQVTIYACGPTVYDSSHLGHARKEINFDAIQRYLRFVGYKVTFVRNITDVDDKIINRAKETGMSPEEVSKKYTQAFHDDMKSLNVQNPDVEPKATEYIAKIIKFNQGLIDSNHAYASGGDVYFDVASFKEYGKLKKQNMEDLLIGARDQVRSQQELKELKKSPVDFALWKSAQGNELAWDSPWGKGRPGWHIECSTMIKEVLGETIDFHCGGEDLMFPHHENEIAQSEALHGKPLARYWLHNGFLQIDAEKMSKSLGNFKTIKDVLKSYSPDTIRLFILQAHYRAPIDFSSEGLDGAKAGVQRLTRASAAASIGTMGKDTIDELAERTHLQKELQEFKDAMDNDFNTPVALSVLFGIADKIFEAQKNNAAEISGYVLLLKQLSDVLGLSLKAELSAETCRELALFTKELNKPVNNGDEGSGDKLMSVIIDVRNQARQNKDYATSDLVRDRLGKLGIKLKDSKDGTSWEID